MNNIYVRDITDEDAKIIAEQVFGKVDDLLLSNSKNGSRILQFEAGGKLCRYELRDFGLTSVSARISSRLSRASAERLAEMYSAYLKYMKTAQNELGQLRFPNYIQDLNEAMGTISTLN